MQRWSALPAGPLCWQCRWAETPQFLESSLQLGHPGIAPTHILVRVGSPSLELGLLQQRAENLSLGLMARGASTSTLFLLVTGNRHPSGIFTPRSHLHWFPDTPVIILSVLDQACLDMGQLPWLLALVPCPS